MWRVRHHLTQSLQQVAGLALNPGAWPLILGYTMGSSPSSHKHVLPQLSGNASWTMTQEGTFQGPSENSFPQCSRCPALAQCQASSPLQALLYQIQLVTGITEGRKSLPCVTGEACLQGKAEVREGRQGESPFLCTLAPVKRWREASCCWGQPRMGNPWDRTTPSTKK